MDAMDESPATSAPSAPAAAAAPAVGPPAPMEPEVVQTAAASAADTPMQQSSPGAEMQSAIVAVAPQEDGGAAALQTLPPTVPQPAPTIIVSSPMRSPPSPLQTQPPMAPALPSPTSPGGIGTTIRVTSVPVPEQGPYRQLKVEDALAYLDKVKTQFQSKPHIYNKFLEIMKSFKAQSIDTPGVIRRVSELFKGHNNLILGFNTFLPPGYKIELISMPATGSGPVPAGEGSSVLMQTSPQGTSALVPTASTQQGASATGGGAGGVGFIPVGAPSTAVITPGGGPSGPAGTAAPPPGGPAASGQAAPGGAPSGPGSRPPIRPAAVPPVRTGPGGAAGPQEFDHAINYVTKIKRRFQYDPNTYKAFLEILHTYQKQQRSIKDVLERVSVLFKDHPDLLRDFTYFLPDAVQENAKERIQRVAEGARQRESSEHGGGAAVEAGSVPSRATGRGSRGGRAHGYGGNRGDGGPAHAQQAAMMRGGIEGGGRGQGVVPVMGKDRERVHQLERDADREYTERMDEDRARADVARESDRERERVIDRQRDRLTVGMGQGKSHKAAAAARKRRGKEEELHLTLTPSERNFFGRVRACLGTREAFAEFLKCLDLYAADVLSRFELISLLQEVFGPTNVKLLDELKSLLNNRGTLDMTPEDVWYCMPVGEIDFSACPRCTPSYRALPAGYPKLACSERSKAEQEVLNDLWVSVPTGSEDFSFKVMRKNQYEDALFRCEDERFEVDMVLDNSAAAIRVLEPLWEEIAALKEHSKGVEWQFRLDRRSLGVLHLKAIARVYGDYGHEMLELLRKNPAGAIPVILSRLKQKDDEWRKARSELNKNWKDSMEKNYAKSLDHRSFYFKQADRKAVTAKALLAEMRAKVDALEAAVREFLTQASEAAAEGERVSVGAALSAQSAAAALGSSSSSDAAAEGDGKSAAAASAMDEEQPTVAVAPAAAAAAAAPVADAAGAAADGAPTAAPAAPPAEPLTGISPGSSSGEKLVTPSALPAALKAKLRAMAPVMHFTYTDAAVHRDTYGVLAYAVERGAGIVSGKEDKGLIADLWRSFLSRFFCFPGEWTAAPSAASTASPSSSTSSFPSVPLLPMGMAVMTPYGLGVIEALRVGGQEVDEEEAAEAAAAAAAKAAVAAAAALKASSSSSSAMDEEGGAAAASSEAASTAAAAALAADTARRLACVVTYTVMLPWGRGFLSSSSVTPASGAGGAAAAAVSSAIDAGARIGIRGGGEQPLTAPGPLGGRVRPINADSALARTTAAAQGAPASAAGAAAAAAAGAGSVAVMFPEGAGAAAAVRAGDSGVPTASLAIWEGVAAGAAGPPNFNFRVEGDAVVPESVFYTTSGGYVFFRLHQMLAERLTTAKALCATRGRPTSAAAAPAAQPSEGAMTSTSAADAGAGAISTSSVPPPPPDAADATFTSGAAAAAAAAASSESASASSSSSMMAVEGEGSSSGGPASAQVDAAAVAAAAAGAARYQHFLTALYALIDGTMDSSKFEDECRELMGTGAYLLFTMDRLVATAAKSLTVLCHDAVAIRLRSLWEYTQAKVTLARKVPGAAAAGGGGATSTSDVERSVADILAAYRASVGGAIVAAGKGAEDIYAVQYAPAAASASASSASSTSAAPVVAASLSFRYLGRPVFNAKRSAIRGFQYASALPAYLSRLVGGGRLLSGDETLEVLDEEAIVEEIAAEAESKGRAPFLSRNVKVQSISSSGAPTSATAAPSSSSLAAKGAAAAAAAPPTARAAAAGATPPGAVVQSRVVAAVGDGGALTFQQGKEDVVFRPR